MLTLSKTYLDAALLDADVEFLKDMELEGVLTYLVMKIENEEDDGLVFENMLQAPI